MSISLCSIIKVLDSVIPNYFTMRDCEEIRQSRSNQDTSSQERILRNWRCSKKPYWTLTSTIALKERILTVKNTIRNEIIAECRIHHPWRVFIEHRLNRTKSLDAPPYKRWEATYTSAEQTKGLHSRIADPLSWIEVDSRAIQCIVTGKSQLPTSTIVCWTT